MNYYSVYERTVLLCSVLLFSFICNAQSAEDPLGESVYDCNRSIQVVNDTLVVTYEFNKINEYSVDNSNMIYHQIEGFGLCSEEGMPRVPVRIDTFRVPFGFTPQISVRNIESRYISCEYAGVPANGVEDTVAQDDLIPVCEFEGIFPAMSASIIGQNEFRGENILEIAVSPIQYDYKNSRACINVKLEYKIFFSVDSDNLTYSSGNAKFSLNSASLYLSHYLQNAYIGAESEIGINEEEEFTENSFVQYLIVTTHALYESVYKFALWKRKMGFNPIILSREKWENYEQVLSSIRSVRSNYPNIQYLLIVGDNEDVPAKCIVKNLYSSQDYFSDTYFASMSDDSYNKEIYMGRIPVSSFEEAEIVLRKIARLEMCPIIDSDYYKRAIHCGYFQPKADKKTEARRFIQTSEDVINYVNKFNINPERFYRADPAVTPMYYDSYYGSGEEIPNFLRKPNFSWTVNNLNIVKEMDDGCLYALYRGHGSFEGWASISFLLPYLNFINPNDMPFTVFSTTCNTGMFNNDCFAENLLRIEDGGASSVIAASSVSYSGYNDALVLGMFDAIWPNPGLVGKFGDSNVSNLKSTIKPIYRMGQILAQGLFRMNEQYGFNKLKIKYQNEVFHLFGDPSMQFYTEMPTPFSNVEILKGNNEVIVSTNGEVGTIIIEDRDKHTVYQFETDYCVYSCTDPNLVSVTITGQNKLPYLGGTNMRYEDEDPYKDVLTPSPRPSQIETDVAMMSFDDDIVTIEVYDISGSLVVNTKLNSSDYKTLCMEMLNVKGVYIVKVIHKDMVVESFKIIK